MQQTMKRCALISGVITLAAAILWMVLSKDFALTIAITTGTVFYHIGIRLLVGWAFDRFMDNQADYRKKWYQELICKGWFLPPNTYDCGSFVVNGTAVIGKESKYLNNS